MAAQGIKLLKKLHWRRTKKERFKPGNISRLFLLALSVVLLVGLSWRLYSSWVSRIWLEPSRITVVVVQEDPILYSYNPQTRSIFIVKIPKSTQIEASYGYGNWFAGSLFDLGRQEGLKGDLLVKSLQKEFGIPIDAWVDRRGEVLFTRNGYSGFFGETNLTFFDRLNLILAISGSDPSLYREIDLVAEGVIKEIKLTDGEEGFEVIPERAKVVFELLKDDAVLSERKTAVIVNLSEEPGLAGKVAQIAGTLGIRVIGVQTGNVGEETCSIHAFGEDSESLSVQRIGRVLGCKIQDQNHALSVPADIEIRLGEEFAKRF